MSKTDLHKYIIPETFSKVIIDENQESARLDASVSRQIAMWKKHLGVPADWLPVPGADGLIEFVAPPAPPAPEQATAD